MGTEFIEKTRKSAKKYLDRRRAELCEADLFKADPETAARQYRAKAEGRSDLRPGDPLQIESEGNSIILRRRGRVVGRNECPSPSLKRVVASAGGFFPGAVSSVHPISSTFDFQVTAPRSDGTRHG